MERQASEQPRRVLYHHYKRRHGREGRAEAYAEQPADRCKL